MRIFIILIASVLLLGCSSNPSGYTSNGQVEDALIDQSKEFIVAKFGAPNERTQVSDNTESWTYKSFSSGLTGGNCNVTITFVSDKVKKVIINADDRSWIAYPLGSCENLFKNLQ
ncbi:hypothetical protein [Psychromonas sp.]|uniref:hypothetical protein n=1 Tax=Psychromonas sp. TaxID=1884585 RepID=UPI00356313C4